MDLAGQLLIAMPGMDDSRFAGAVILICASSDAGAMGLIVNKYVADMRLGEVWERMEIDAGEGPSAARVHFGGPVQTERGFVLHPERPQHEAPPLVVPGGYAVTATQDILEDLAEGHGPDSFIFALGYAGWGPGQLAGEIAQNGWLTAPARPELVFTAQPGGLWEAALESIGIDPLGLSAVAGRA